MSKEGALPKAVKLVGIVERFNRQAAAVGQNGKTKASRGVVQLKRVQEDCWQLWVSVTNNLDGQRYDVRNIQKLRTTFVSEGKLTLELSQPPFNVMLRDCNSSDLSTLVDTIQLLQKNPVSRHKAVAELIQKKSTPKVEPAPSGSKTVISKCKAVPGSAPQGAASSSKSKASKALEVVKPVVAHNVQALPEEPKPDRRSGLKRPMASMDMSKTEASSIRKSLKLAPTSLKISQRSEYPLRGFPSDLKSLYFNGLLLRKIDYRIQDLLYLKSLALPGNRITSIDMLAFLRCQLESLNLAGNEIERIGADVFRAKAFMGLRYLNLSKNQLKAVPNSILELSSLSELYLSNNRLQVLPYNLHWLSALLTLKLDDNRLRALPYPIMLMKLNVLDISVNVFPLSLKEAKARVELDSTPTLFELAGAAFMNSFSKNKFRCRYDVSLLPKIINEYLANAKYCRRCGKMCMRYLITYHYASDPIALEMSRSSRSYPVCVIKCDKCSKNEVV